MIFIVFIFAAIYALYWYYYSNPKALREQCTPRDIEPAPSMNFVLMLLFRKHPEQEYYNYISKNPRPFGFFSFNTMTIGVINPELIQLVLSKEFSTFVNRRVCWSILQWFSTSLSTSYKS